MTRLGALAGITCISFSAIFVRLAAVSPTTAAFYRCAYAIPFLGLLWVAVRRQDRRPARDRWLAFLSGFFLSLDLSSYHRSILWIGAGLATVLSNTQVVFVGVLAWLLHRERPNRLAVQTLPAILFGVVLISGLGRTDAYGTRPVVGALFGLMTGIAYACFLLVFRASNRDLAPTSGPLLEATCGAALGCLAVGTLEPGFDLTFSWPAHAWLLALSLVCQVAGWLLISAALPRLAALETSVMLLTQPMLTVLWARLIFVERLSPLQWTGAVLVLAGVGVLSTRGSVEEGPAI